MILINGAHIWDTYMRHIHETHIWDTYMGHIYGTHIWDTHMRHTYETHIWDTYMRHIYKPDAFCTCPVGYLPNLHIWTVLSTSAQDAQRRINKVVESIDKILMLSACPYSQHWLNRHNLDLSHKIRHQNRFLHQWWNVRSLHIQVLWSYLSEHMSVLQGVPLVLD